MVGSVLKKRAAVFWIAAVFFHIRVFIFLETVV